MASSPGFGYIFIGQPQIAQFQQLGNRFFISYLPKTIPEQLEGQQVCLWLGPGMLNNSVRRLRLMCLSRFLEARNDGISHMAWTRNYLIWFSVCSVFLFNEICHLFAPGYLQDSLRNSSPLAKMLAALNHIHLMSLLMSSSSIMSSHACYLYCGQIYLRLSWRMHNLYLLLRLQRNGWTIWQASWKVHLLVIGIRPLRGSFMFGMNAQWRLCELLIHPFIYLIQRFCC